MKTNQQNQAEVINRINRLNEQSKPRRGKISISQMLNHCIAILQVTAAHQFSPESFADHILKAITKSASPQNSAIMQEKEQLIDCVKQYGNDSNAGVYQNIDKYLRKFSV